MQKERVIKIVVGVAFVLVILFFDYIWQFVEGSFGALTVPGFSRMTDRLLLIVIALLAWIGWEVATIKGGAKK